MQSTKNVNKGRSDKIVEFSTKRKRGGGWGRGLQLGLPPPHWTNFVHFFQFLMIFSNFFEILSMFLMEALHSKTSFFRPYVRECVISSRVLSRDSK